jgi:hypothetical protein
MSQSQQQGDKNRSQIPRQSSSSSTRQSSGRSSPAAAAAAAIDSNSDHSNYDPSMSSSAAQHGSGFVDGVVANFGCAVQGFFDAFAWPSALITTYT